MTKHLPIQLDEIIFKHLIVHWYEEMQLNIECLHNRAGKWLWPCARYSYTS